MTAQLAPIKKTFEQRIEQEFIHGSAIDADLFKSAIAFIEDEGRWEPNYALNQKVSTQWQTKPPHSYGSLAALVQETGELWQGKPEFPRLDWKKGKLEPIKYETVKGNGSRAFLPAIPLSVWRKICDRNHIKEESIWLRALEKGLLTLKMIDGLSKRQSDKSPRSSSDLGSPDVFFPSTETTLKDSQPKSSKGFGNASQTNDSYSSDADLAKLLKCLIETIPSDTLVPDFWGCVEEFNIDLIITEGGKKALCLLSLGYVAIALSGCHGGYLSKCGDGFATAPYLTEDVARFAKSGRRFTLAFDQDAKPTTIETVQHALARLGGLLIDCECEVAIASWQPGQGKGVDDLIVQSGAEAWEIAYSKATPLAPSDVSDRAHLIAKRRQHFLKNYWGNLQKDFRLSPSTSRTIETYEGYAPTLSLDTNTILLRGWLGSGKTEAVIRSLVPHKDKQIVWISGRNGLLRQTAERMHKLLKLGFTAVYHFQDDPGLYREMLRDGHPGIYIMCPDSLKDYAVKHCDWKNTILVIDEFSGIRREVLGKTEIMPEFERLLSESQTLIAIDAFLGDIDARIISRYRPSTRAIYDQTFSQSQKPIQWLETRTKDGKISMSHDGIAYSLLRQWVTEGHRIAIATDSKLNAKICDRFLRSLGYSSKLCTSETIESNQRLLHDPDLYLAETGAQVLIYSPTAQSGLDVQTHFDRGLALYSGVISPLDFLQMIGRCRQCDQWAVSAPRRSLDPDCLVHSLDSPKLLKRVEKLQQSFTDLDIESSAKTRGWGLWQDSTREIEKSFHSEYLQQLLIHFFKSVETVEVDCDRSTYRADSKAIKQEEAVFKLSANLANGQRIISQQKAPSTDAQVWDIALAEQHDRYPKIWDLLLEVWSSTNEESKEWAVGFAIVASSSRIEKLKHWVSATGENAGEDLAALRDQVKRRFTSYTSRHYKELQFCTLFQELDLKALATVREKENAIAHQNHFIAFSTKIGELWNQFQLSPRLTRLFPFVDTQTEFFAIVKRCMSFHGGESTGKTIRQRSEKLHPNGKDRHGNPRLSPSQSVWFVGWLIMEESGNKFFQENFWLIVEAISDRLTHEREQRRQWLERQQPPPIAA